MKQNIKSFAVLCDFILITILGHSQETVQKKIYTLKPNEKIIFTDEHSLSVHADETNFLFFTERVYGKDTTHFAVYSGKEYGPYDEILHPEINLLETRRYFYFVGMKNGELYVNMSGTEYGPYEELSPKGNCCYHLLLNPDGNFAFAFLQDGKWSININGRETKAVDPSSQRFNIFDLKLYKDGSYYFHYKEGEDYVLNINGIRKYNVKKINSVLHSNSETLLVVYQTDQGTFINNKSQQYGPYTRTGFASTNSNGEFYYSFELGGKWYVNANGNIEGTYDEISNYYGIKSDLSGNYYYSYRVENEWFIRANGKSFGPFQKKNTQVFFNNGIPAYTYQEDDKIFYFINDKTYGPYENRANSVNSRIQFPNDSTFAVVCKKNDSFSLSINGKKTITYDKIALWRVHSSESYLILGERDEKFYINAGGTEYGPFQEFKRYPSALLSDNGNFMTTAKIDDQWKIIINAEAKYSDGDAILKYIDDDANYVFHNRKPEMYFNVNGNKVETQNYARQVYFYKNSGYVIEAEAHYSTAVIHNGKLYENTMLINDNEKENFMLGNSRQVIVNGKQVGDGGFMFQYLEEKHSFSWMSLSGRSIILYEHPINRN